MERQQPVRLCRHYLYRRNGHTYGWTDERLGCLRASANSSLALCAGYVRAEGAFLVPAFPCLFTSQGEVSGSILCNQITDHENRNATGCLTTKQRKDLCTISTLGTRQINRSLLYYYLLPGIAGSNGQKPRGQSCVSASLRRLACRTPQYNPIYSLAIALLRAAEVGSTRCIIW